MFIFLCLKETHGSPKRTLAPRPGPQALKPSSPATRQRCGPPRVAEEVVGSCRAGSQGGVEASLEGLVEAGQGGGAEAGAEHWREGMQGPQGQRPPTTGALLLLRLRLQRGKRHGGRDRGGHGGGSSGGVRLGGVQGRGRGSRGG